MLVKYDIFFRYLEENDWSSFFELIRRYGLNHEFKLEEKNLFHFLAIYERGSKGIELFLKYFTKEQLKSMFLETNGLGNNIFHFAAYRSYQVDTLRFLLEFAREINLACPNLPNNIGTLPTQLAENEEWIEIMEAY